MKIFKTFIANNLSNNPILGVHQFNLSAAVHLSLNNNGPRKESEPACYGKVEISSGIYPRHIPAVTHLLYSRNRLGDLAFDSSPLIDVMRAYSRCCAGFFRFCFGISYKAKTNSDSSQVNHHSQRHFLVQVVNTFFLNHLFMFTLSNRKRLTQRYIQITQPREIDNFQFFFLIVQFFKLPIMKNQNSNLQT